MTLLEPSVHAKVRQDIIAAYGITELGTVKSLGKFQGEMIYVPYMWRRCLDGMYAEDIANVFFIPFDDDDRAAFPEIGTTYGIALKESDNGFVYGIEYETQADYNKAVAHGELISAELSEDY
jgi:hypothetical protein